MDLWHNVCCNTNHSVLDGIGTKGNNAGETENLGQWLKDCRVLVAQLVAIN